MSHNERYYFSIPGIRSCSAIVGLLADDPKNEFVIQKYVVSRDIQGEGASLRVCGDNNVAAVFFCSPASEDEADDKGAYNHDT
jgi:hypothetical protein